MDKGILWRSALVQLLAVAVLFVILALALPKSFFESWGWLTGPVAWLGCAALTARVLGLPTAPTLLGAALAGLPSLVLVAVGLHKLAIVPLVVLFALWCARTPGGYRASTSSSRS